MEPNLTELNLAQRIEQVNTELDETPVVGQAQLLVDHPLTRIITGFFETLGQDPADRWIAGSDVRAIGGMHEIRALINNELRRILSVLELTNTGSSFDMRFLLNRDTELEPWLETLYQHVCPFIMTNRLLEPISTESSSPAPEATPTD